MAEHAGRYERFAEAAVQEGFIVVAHDARAHGKTAERATLPGPGCADLGSAGALRLVEDLKELIKAK
jgi:alpha-beta hydrolase superfamily lysophospholipase